ncbi:hypothetical protein, partial [Azotobacter vinelandii]|uniref:hypothetical protein n=1 Tax=Azotobacter vinelandii TaxID=354 RepID=UPI001C318112
MKTRTCALVGIVIAGNASGIAHRNIGISKGVLHDACRVRRLEPQAAGRVRADTERAGGSMKISPIDLKALNGDDDYRLMEL